MAQGGGKAPRTITWVICLVLYLIAIAHHFGIYRFGGELGTWSWIVGFGLLLLAVRLRGL